MERFDCLLTEKGPGVIAAKIGGNRLREMLRCWWWWWLGGGMGKGPDRRVAVGSCPIIKISYIRLLANCSSSRGAK